MSIIATVTGAFSFCCIGLVLGIIAIAKASSVDSLYYQGLYAKANSNAQSAKTLSLITLGIVALSLIFAIIQLIISGTEGFETWMEAAEGYR